MTVEKLTGLGANTAEGVKRCAGNEAFYLKMVSKALEPERFDRLEKYIAAGDRKAAFEEAHALKGILANLSLTPLLKPVDGITELLRDGSDADCGGLLDDIRKIRNEFVRASEGTAG